MSERESRPGESGPFVSLDAVPVTGGMSGGMVSGFSDDIIPTGGWPRVDKIHGVLTDDPQLLSAVVKAIDGDDGAAVMIIAEKFRLSGVEADEVLTAVLGEGKRPAGCFLNKQGRLEVMATAEEMQRSADRVSTAFHRTIQPDGFGVDPEAEKRVDAMMGRHMADWKTYPLTLDAPSLTGLTLTMPSATHPSGVRSLSLEEIDAVFSALDEERRQTGEDLEAPSETLAWMRREVARLDTFESAFLVVNELCPPSDWLRDLKAASHDPGALVELLRRATAARAEKDKAGSEGFQTPSAPAQPSPALFDADQPDWLPDGWTCRLSSYTGPGGMRVFTDGGGRAVAWGSTHPDIEAWTEWNEQDKRALVMALADPWRVTGPGGEATDGTAKPPTFEPAQPTPLPAMLTAAQSFILADICLDATPYEKGAHDAATAILRGDLSTGDPRVTLRGQVEEARQTAHALESMLVQVKAERDRALAVLAAETGKQGLPGWTWDEREREWSIYYRSRAVRLTAWGATVSGGPAFHARIGIKALSTGSNVSATDALNAMEKATAWARVRGYTGEAPDLEAIVPVQARTEIAHLWEQGAYGAAVEVYRSCFLEYMAYNEACNALDLYFGSKPKAEPTPPEDDYIPV